MSDTEKKNNEQMRDKDILPTASFNGSAVQSGTQIGQFRIERELGRGAAGVVYLAHDTKLDRSVAIKSLPAKLMENTKARTRFAREARLLASVNHPNIATIHEVLEEAEGVGYLVLEYVPGQTLAERIAKSKLKLQDVLTIALQIAEAVAAAHDHGVVHRDLKPGNIKITPEGKVKVLDFGLAKVVGGEAADQQSTVTEPGRVIGTPAYMSPEQARGQATDKRSDIWSFGCILYEMLTGKLPFRGETISDTLANILQTEPNWHVLPETTPASIRSLLRHCLEKDPRRRLRDIGDAGIQISETLTDFGSAELVSNAAQSTPQSMGLRRMAVLAVVCILIGAIAATVISWNLKRPIPAQMPLSVFSIRLPQNQALTEQHPEIAVSPDGKKLVYVGGVGANRQLFLRELDQFESRELSETQGAFFPFFSPDGRSIGFGSGNKLKTLSLEGGRPKILCDASDLWGASWGQDGEIYFSPSGTTGLWKISVDGGKPERLTTPKEGEFAHIWPEVLPGGDYVLFTTYRTDICDNTIAVLSLKTGQWQTILVGGSNARYAPTGHLLYAQSGTLMAAPFDLKQLKIGEPRRPVIESLNHEISSGYAPFCFSQEGLLYYVRGGEWLARRQFVWVNRQGEEVETLSLPPQAYKHPRLSPNEKRFAYTKFEGGQENIWVYDLPNGPAAQITFKSSNFLPLWRPPDGDRLTFTSYRSGPWTMYEIPTNRSSTTEPIIERPNDQVATSWSPEGKVLLFNEISPVTGYDISCLYTEDENTQQSLIHESWIERNAVFSPNGNWIAYQSDQEGLSQVYVSPYPEPAPKKISTGGGYNPLWSPDGKEIFYRNGDKMIAVTVETEPEIRVINSEVLFEGQYYTDSNRSYDVSRDGQRFLMIKESEDQPVATQLIVVLNWFEELKRLVPPGKDL